MKFAPSILSADFGRLADAARAVEAAGADWLHVDVMDGHFVPNLTFGPKMVSDLRRATRLPLDVHLMIERPDDWVDRYVEAGAAYLTVHVEATADARATLARIRERGAKAGISLNPETALERVFQLLDAADLALVMSVRPGFGGQSFIEGSLDRIASVRRELDRRGLRGVELEVDGGVRASNAKACVSAGATVLVAGSAVYEDPAGPAAGLAKLRSAVSS